MNDIQKLLKKLDVWISQAEHTRARSEGKLSEYSEMSVRKFSNINAEKSANYVRIPSSVSMDNLALWNAAIGAKKIYAQEIGFQKYFGISAGYLYLSFRTQLQAYEKGVSEKCSVLRDWVASLYFLLASCEHSDEFDKVCCAIKKLNDRRALRDLGSKVAVFCVSLNDMAHGDSESAISNFERFSKEYKDTTGALDIYKKLIQAFDAKTANSDFEALIEQALDVHLMEAIKRESDDEFYDFSLEPWSVVPSEVIGYVNVVKRKFGIDIAYPASKLGEICQIFSKNIPVLEFDELALRVSSRAEKVFF